MLGRQRLAAGVVLGVLMIASFGGSLPAPAAPAVPPSIEKYEVSTFDRTSLLDAANQGEVQMALLGHKFVLEVFPSLIHAPDATVTELDENGVVRVYALEPVPTFHGKVKDRPDSFLALTFTADGVSGFVYDTEWIDFQPLATFDSRASPGQHLVYRSRDVKWDVSFEGDGGEPPTAEFVQKTPEWPNAQVSDKSLHSYVDYQFYNQYCPGGGFCTEHTTQISNIMNRVNAIYNNYAGFSILSTWYTVCTTYACDQNENLHVTNAATLVNNFRTYMNSDHCCGFGIAHLWSYKNFDSDTIGRAYAIPSRYAISQHRAEGGYSASDYQRGILVAHEMGHDFDAKHDYAESWFDIWCWCTKYTIMWPTLMGDSMAEKFSNTNKDRIINANNNWNNVGY